MNRLCCLFVLLVFSFSSCKIVPFFIPKENIDKREQERLDRIEKRKNKTKKEVDRKKEKNKSVSKRKLKKLNRLEKKLPKDTVVQGLDSASIATQNKKLDALAPTSNSSQLAKQMMAANAVNYKAVKIKTKMAYSAGTKNQKFSAQFRINKDKEIWVSISALKIEVARALITPDSVKAIDRINKKFYLFSYQDIVQLINIDIDFHILQDIIVGDAIGKNGNVFDYKDIGATVNVGLKSSDFVNFLTYNKSDSTLRQVQLQLIRGQLASNILGMISDYEKENGRLISKKRIYNIEDTRGKFNLEMEINKVDFDAEHRVPFSIPPTYKEAELKR